ncbi:MAG: SRPBCC family protein [Acidobacteria bacterium]|nr:SRPBCC family protein [Acidobacteriota bacterium]
MRITNVHERRLASPPQAVGELLDSLGSDHDRLWPRGWPKVRFDRPLGAGARGGHGPIRYRVETWIPGETVRFRFEAPRGFDGFHAFGIRPEGEGSVVRHVIEMKARGRALLSWFFVIRPLHDALIEDAFSTVEASLALPVTQCPWSWRVRMLRRILR